jgi:4-amino-4-deoxy-L-arabinose transferase-like glycosyltransferase
VAAVPIPPAWRDRLIVRAGRAERSRSGVWLDPALAAILGLAIVVRVIVGLFVPPLDFQDALLYREEAENLLAGRLIQSHLVMPLYPLAIALLGGGRLGQSAVSLIANLAIVAIAYRLTYEITKRQGPAVVAGVALALLPSAIFYSLVGLTESLFTALMLGALISLYTGRTVAASVLLVLAILTRPTLDILAPGIVVWTALVVRQVGWRLAARDLGIYVAIYVTLMSPWWIHNFVKYGTLVRLNLGAGVVLYAGNNPKNDTGGGIAGHDVDFSEFDRIPDPIMREKAMRDAAIAFVRQNPDRAIELVFMKFERFWRVVPFAPRFRGNLAAIAVTIAIAPLLCFAVSGVTLLRHRFRQLTLILISILYIMLVHMVTIGSIRYRFPVEPLLVVLGAPALWLVSRRIWQMLAGCLGSPAARNPSGD